VARFKGAVAEPILSRTVLFCVVFIGLNILDAWLTGLALRAGNYELNPLLGARFGSNMVVKGLISAGIVVALVLFKRDRLLKPLSLGMLLICTWNCVAVLIWK
jgi:hypothetical protein